MDTTLSPPDTKRRKLRKGTHSCWQCKRRKMKCVFDSVSDTMCKPCRHRGSKCVTQDLPEDSEIPECRSGRELDKQVSWDSNRPDDGQTPLRPAASSGKAYHGIPTPSSTTAEKTTFFPYHQSPEHSIPTSHRNHEKLSRFLHGSLPSLEDTERICATSRGPSVLSHEILTMPYSTLDKTGLKTTESLLEIPDPTLHPVLIARHMLQLAILLQHLHPDLHTELRSLSEAPRVIMERLADLAINLVTTKDELLGSIEGLECVMIESMYQANIGSLRRSWVANRRAMGIAQLMGLDRQDHRTQFQVLDPNTRCHPQLMWFRIVFLDRQLCLLLGLPQGSVDRSIASDAMLATDTPMGRLERIHCVLSSKILERNVSSSSFQDYDLMRTLDLELQRAARILPSKWWLAPNLDPASRDSQTLFWDTRRLFAHVIHYNLLNQLHLPYMLRSSSTGRQYEYSRITCVNASREVLSRYITLRSFNQVAYSCRTIDFLALMAAMTLLLAHIDGHHLKGENLLAHQYLSDRAMIERAQENMKKVNRLNSDALSAQSADLLHRLLAVEVDTAEGAQRVSVQRTQPERDGPDHNDDAVVTVDIPYFGIVKIAREGMSKETPKQRLSSTSNRLQRSQGVDTSCTADITTVYTEKSLRYPGSTTGRHEIPHSDATTPVNSGFGHLETPSISQNPTPQLHNVYHDPFLRHDGYPELAAQAEDWAFQGVDMTFFDSLMRSGGSEETGNTGWSV